MRHLRAWAERSMSYCNGQDVLGNMTWTIFENKAQCANTWKKQSWIDQSITSFNAVGHVISITVSRHLSANRE
jgi:hypothetical protein